MMSLSPRPLPHSTVGVTPTFSPPPPLSPSTSSSSFSSSSSSSAASSCSRRQSCLRTVYAPADAPSLLSVPPHSSILHPAVLKSFKLALLKGRRSIPATLSTQQKAAAPTEASSLPSASSERLDDCPSSPPRLSVSSSLPLPLLARQPTESAHVLQPQLKRSFSFTSSSAFSLSSSHSKRHRGGGGAAASLFALAPPSADVTGDAELAAFYIARELVEFSSRFIIVPGEGEQEEEGQRDEAQQAAAVTDAAIASSDVEESEEEGSSDAESEEQSSSLASVQVFDHEGQPLPRWLSACQLKEVEDRKQAAAAAAVHSSAVSVPELSTTQPDDHPELDRPDSLASVDSIESLQLGIKQESGGSGAPVLVSHDDAEFVDSEEEPADAGNAWQQAIGLPMPPPLPAHLPSFRTVDLYGNGVQSTVKAGEQQLTAAHRLPAAAPPCMSAESLFHKLRESFSASAQTAAAVQEAVKSYAPHPLTLLQAASAAAAPSSSSSSSSSGLSLSPAADAAAGSSASPPSPSPDSLYPAAPPSLLPFSSSLFSSSFCAPTPSSPLYLMSSASTSLSSGRFSSFSFSQSLQPPESSPAASSSSLYPQPAASASLSLSAAAASARSSLAFASPMTAAMSLAFGERDVSSSFSLQ